MRNFFLLLCLLMAALYMAACHSNTGAVVQVSTTITGKTTVAGASAKDNDLEAVQPLLTAAPQLFTVAAQTVKKIQGKGGMRVTVDPSKLETDDGKAVSGPIQVTIKEMATSMDMVAENSPTVSDGRLLESGGSYYVGMTCNGKTVRVKEGKTLSMEFPKRTNKKMELFFGERDANGAINWKPIDKKLIPAKEATSDNTATTTAAASPALSRPLDNNGKYTSWTSGRKNNINATKSYHASMLWLAAYEDSVMAARRDWISNSCTKLSLPQVTALMETPVRISRREIARLRIPFTKSSFANEDLSHLTTSITYHLHPIWYLDSMDLTKEFISYQADSSIKWVPANGSLTADKMYDEQHAVETDSSQYSMNTNTDDPSTAIAPDDGSGSVDSANAITVSYYQPVELSGLGYINCDHFYQSPFGTTPWFTLNIQGQAPKVVGVYIIFKDINAMLSDKVYTDSNGTATVAEQLPLNANIEFLVYSKIGNQIVESKQTVKVTQKTIVPIAFKPVADSQVKKLFLTRT